MKKSLLVLMFLAASSSLFAGVHFSVGVRVGPAYGYYAAPPPPAPVYYVPPRPAPGFVWVAGYYNQVGPRYVWHAGYWTRPPYAGAVWVAPRYAGHRYYRGHWRRR
jgi:hypothetical protein